MSVAARVRTIRAPPFVDSSGDARHRPGATLLYQLVEQHWTAFRELRATAGRPLPAYMQQELEAYLKCGRLEEGFLRMRSEQCHAEKLVAFSCKKRGFFLSCGARCTAETAALLADEVLPERALAHAVPRWRVFVPWREPAVFRPVAEPSANELQGLVEQIAARVGQVLERRRTCSARRRSSTRPSCRSGRGRRRRSRA